MMNNYSHTRINRVSFYYLKFFIFFIVFMVFIVFIFFIFFIFLVTDKVIYPKYITTLPYLLWLVLRYYLSHSSASVKCI